jgi:arabinose-5-phosphate isomerase
VVINKENSIEGIITDGDLRRQLIKSLEISKITAREIMTIKPLIINSKMMAIEAFKIMKLKKI